MHIVNIIYCFVLALIPTSVSLRPPRTLADRDDSLNLGAQTRDDCTAQQVIEELGLIPNVEKGFYIETFQDPETYNNRSVSTAIYYLLEGSIGRSVWHRVDATEVWHYYAGAPLSLFLSFDDGEPVREHILGPEIFNGQRPQVVIRPHEWQQALSHGKWTLVGTTGMHNLYMNYQALL